MKLRRRSWIIIALTFMVAVVAASLFMPVGGGAFESHSIPAQNFEEAKSRVNALIKAEHDSIVPACRTQLMSHEAKTARVIVLIHGYTSCPQQFATLGRRFFDEGHNVLIVPLPLHGLPDRMTGVHAQLKASMLTEYADEVIDIAQGLGQEVSVAGLSAGGLITAWIAQKRADVDLCVLISPVMGYAVVPPGLSLPAARIYGWLPDRFEWWDTTLREKLGPDYSYPRYSYRALAQLLRLASHVIADAGKRPPGANAIIVVTNPSDDKISSERIETLLARWRKQNVANGARTRITTFAFPAEPRLGHDIIDPTLSDQRIDIVYPRLMELMRR
jgi:pimeloyl-ACP methyl ester carboxylesterase